MKRRNINIKEQIKNHFFVNPSSMLRVREIERVLKLPLPSIIKYCKELQNEGILTIVKTGNVLFYTADKMNPSFLLEKRLYNLRLLYISGFIEFLKIELSNPSIIVFGSFSKGEDREDSDIDLYVETPSKKEISLDNFERVFKRRLHVFRQKNIREIKNKNLVNNIINGILLNGFVEIVK
jgi:predicted nucleotidyltransferase